MLLRAAMLATGTGFILTPRRWLRGFVQRGEPGVCRRGRRLVGCDSHPHRGQVRKLDTGCTVARQAFVRLNKLVAATRFRTQRWRTP